MKRLVQPLHVVGLFLIAATGLLLAAGNPAVGVWKLNVAGSKYDSATAPKSATRTVEDHADGVIVSYEFVQADGTTVKYGYAGNFDGKDYPVTGSGSASWREDLVSGADTIALRREGSNTYAGSWKKSGNIVMTTRVATSKNGKVTTVTLSGADAKGQPIKIVTVWDKQ